MNRRILQLLGLCIFLFAGALRAAEAPVAAPTPAPAPAAKPGKASVVVIPVREEIATPVLYILRRGLKDAIDRKADAVILDMKTPGGALDVTFEIMEALAKFPGETITYVNTEAISAGAFISASTGEIWFAPRSVIGAAAPVLAGGKDVEATMKQKIVSYLRARVRAQSEGKGYRGQVVSAMIDADYEFKIGDKVIKPKGELLSLTDTEAAATYGDPPQPLLSSGTAPDIDALLTRKYGDRGFTVLRLEITWSEQLAVWLNGLSPILLGLGLLALFIEFKTPGFGIFGVTGILLLLVVFLGSYVAGLSGHEPVVVFAIGLLLVAIEIFLLPGVAVLAVTGLVLMFGALLWSMADIWPQQPISLSGDLFLKPLANIGMGTGLAIVLGALLLRFLPKGLFWDRMVVGATVSGTAQSAGADPSASGSLDALVGQRGLAATALRPSGQVEIGGRRYEARVDVGDIKPGAVIVVRGRSDFGLIVEEVA